MSVALVFAVMPWTSTEIGTDLSIGILYVMAVTSLGTIAILMAGWGSNNKYALLGAFRVIAQLVSYEVPMILALLIPVMLAGTMRMQGLIEAQAGMWFLFVAPLSALIFFVSSTAEVGRQPFDLLEAESEIVAGYNIEYGAMAFAMLYLGEWLHAVIICVITAILFLGGWQGPFVDDLPVLGVIYLAIKSLFLYFVHMWIRFTVPRLRIDHMLAFNWKFLVPLSIANLLLVSFLWKVIPEPSETGFVAEFPRTVTMFIANFAMLFAILSWLRSYARRERAKVEALVDETVYTTTPPQVAAGD